MVFKKKFFAVICLCIAAMLIFAGCNNGNAGTSNSGNNGNTNVEIPEKTDSNGNKVEAPTDTKAPSQRPSIDLDDPTMDGIDTSFAKNFAEMFTERDLAGTYDESQCAIIECDITTIKSSSKAVGISGNKALISKEGTYIIRGTLADGTIIIEADKTAKIQIILDDATLMSETYAAIYVKCANKVFITLADGTVNMVNNGGSFVQTDENNVDGAIFSKDDLTINGTGVLMVESKGGNGIVANDDLVIAGGNYNIVAAGHSIDANDSVRITQASVFATAGKDAIRAENVEDETRGFVLIADGEYQLSAGGDAISATSHVQIDAGTFKIKAGVDGDVEAENAQSMKGIRADGNLLFAAGEASIETPDDAVNVKGSIIMVSGSFEVKAGDDAFHAEDTIYAVKADVEIKESYECYEALHVEIRGGKHTLNSKDDAINAAGGADGSGEASSIDGTLKISGGEMFVTALGDGFDVKGSFEMTGGLVVISVSAKEDHAAFDYIGSGVIKGGMFVAAGSTHLPQIPTGEGQGVISINAGKQAAGTEVTLTDKDGKTVIYEAIALDFEVIVVSSPEIVKGESYKVVVGTQTGNFTAK